MIFAPQRIDTEVFGRRFQEMHVDGSVSVPVFTLPDTYLHGGKTMAARRARRDIYVIENGRIEAGFGVAPDQSEAIAARSFSTMNRVGVQAVVAQTDKTAKKDGIGFHLTLVGKDFPEISGTGFETDTMRRLYGYGSAKARDGAFWSIEPPQIAVAKQTASTSTP
ncbi:MAG: hypothetical protein P4L82_00390 [Ancalomicrobiaceae bacterium]|nr:hypothetical protein [Ancalomicrobiaceae bacterium]